MPILKGNGDWYSGEMDNSHIYVKCPTGATSTGPYIYKITEVRPFETPFSGDVFRPIKLLNSKTKGSQKKMIRVYESRL